MMLFVHFFINLIRYIITLGQKDDLFKTEEVELKQEKYTYS